MFGIKIDFQSSTNFKMKNFQKKICFHKGSRLPLFLKRDDVKTDEFNDLSTLWSWILKQRSNNFGHENAVSRPLVGLGRLVTESCGRLARQRLAVPRGRSFSGWTGTETFIFQMASGEEQRCLTPKSNSNRPRKHCRSVVELICSWKIHA